MHATLFATEPAKVRDGYANSAVSEPPLKLVLVENPGHAGSINHLGVEVADTDIVDVVLTRLAEAGLALTEERATAPGRERSPASVSSTPGVWRPMGS